MMAAILQSWGESWENNRKTIHNPNSVYMLNMLYLKPFIFRCFIVWEIKVSMESFLYFCGIRVLRYVVYSLTKIIHNLEYKN